MSNTRGWTAAVLVLGVCALGSMGCSRYGAYCTDAADCERGNDADIEACEISLSHDEDQADLWGCTDEWDRYFECAEERAFCNNDRHWTTGDNCRYDAEDLHVCVN